MKSDGGDNVHDDGDDDGGDNVHDDGGDNGGDNDGATNKK
jgi:hypothetical protein